MVNESIATDAVCDKEEASLSSYIEHNFSSEALASLEECTLRFLDVMHLID